MGSVDGFDTIPEIFPCPVCLELPVLKKVFQCRHGHLLCEECYASIKICPQCRVPFDPEPIRSLAVEMLLDQLPFLINCPYDTSGCKMRMTNHKALENHVKCCRFGPPLCICKNLGFPNCNFRMNGGTTVEEAIYHFETAHGAVTMNSDRMQVEFSHYAKFSGGPKLFIMNQKKKGYAYLILVKHMWELNWTPLYLRYPMLGHPSGVDLTGQRFITSSYPTQPKPVMLYDSQLISNILNYPDPSVVNQNQQNKPSKLMEFWKATSKNLFVSVEVREVRNAFLNLGRYLPHIVVTPNEIRAGSVESLEMLSLPISSSSASLAASTISFGPAESTVPVKLYKVPDILRCPVCRELPRSSVFQCRQGHTICEDCNAQQINCHQCRILFDMPPIRSLAMEMLLDELNFELNCRYQMFGCNLKMRKPKSLQDHSKCCNYRFGRPVSVCQALGFETCFALMTPGTTVEGAIEHFEKMHGAATTDSDTVEVEFTEYFKLSGGTKLIILNQKVNGYACLILAKHLSTSPQQLNLIPFYLQYPTLGASTDFDLTKTRLVTSSLSQYSKSAKSKVEFEYYQPVWDILESPNQSSLLNLYEMLNIKLIDKVLGPGPSPSIFVCIGVRRTENATKNQKQIPLITTTSSEMTKNVGPSLQRFILRARNQNPSEEISRLLDASCSFSCDVGNPNANPNEGGLRCLDGKNKKRDGNSKSGCTIV